MDARAVNIVRTGCWLTYSGVAAGCVDLIPEALLLAWTMGQVPCILTARRENSTGRVLSQRKKLLLLMCIAAVIGGAIDIVSAIGHHHRSPETCELDGCIVPADSHTYQ